MLWTLPPAPPYFKILVRTLVPSLPHFQEQLLQLRRHDPSALNQQDVRAYFQNITTATAMLNSKPRAERKTLVESLTDYQTTRLLISVFLADPELAFAVSAEVLRGVVLARGRGLS